MAIKTTKNSFNKQPQEQEKPVVISTVSPKTVLDNVFAQLGKPKDMCMVSPGLTRATPVTQKNFRVQIYRETPYNTLTDTFFVTVNPDGKIVRSDPAIEKKY